MIKYCTFLALILGSFLTVNAQETVIKGISKKTKFEQVKLFSVAAGKIEEIATVKPAANGSFSFKFKPAYKGFYLVGSGNSENGLQDKFKLYVNGNEQINLELTDTMYQLKGVNSKENQVLEKWFKTVYKLERKTIYFNRGPRNYNDFFSILEDAVAKASNWDIQHKTGNTTFDQLMNNTIKYDIAHYALTLLLYPAASKPRVEDYTPYVKQFNSDHFLQDESLLQFPYGITMLNNLVAFKNRAMAYDLDQYIMTIPNDNLKGDYALIYADQAISYNKYKEIADTYDKYFLRADQKAGRAEIEAKKAIFKPGVKAINFTYPDVNGKEVSLTDFVGKVVLIDIWATWCGPCVKEIPSLKQLEHEFEGKDVVFISVSVDSQKDIEKWKKFVEVEKLGGVQLFAGAKPKISMDYKVKGIPRFMLFDKKGNIIDVDAPRPSNPKLKEIINAFLN